MNNSPIAYEFGNLDIEETFNLENDLSSSKRYAIYYNAISELNKKSKGKNSSNQQQTLSGNTRKEFKYIEDLIQLIDLYRHDDNISKDDFLRKVDQLHSQTFQFSSRLKIYLRCKSYQYLNYPVTMAMKDEHLSSSKYYGIKHQFNTLLDEKRLPKEKLMPIQRHMNKTKKIAALTLLSVEQPFEYISELTGYSIPSLYRLRTDLLKTQKDHPDDSISNIIQKTFCKGENCPVDPKYNIYSYCSKEAIDYTIKKYKPSIAK